MDRARVITLFTGVVRAGSFSQAAVEAGLTPQAVSKAVRQLEQHLGVRLFHRTTRSLSLTEEGARLFELASPGLRLLGVAGKGHQRACAGDGKIDQGSLSWLMHFLSPLFLVM